MGSREASAAFAVRTGCAFAAFVLLSGAAMGQATFDVASVRPSARLVGPDENNRFSFDPAGITGRNVTLRRLVAEAYRLQLNQVIGPGWLDQNEYDVDAKADTPADRDRLAPMLRTLLAERFGLKQHTETRNLRVYELVVDKGGPKIHPGEKAVAGSGFVFRGDMPRFADLLAVQLSIVVPDDPSRPGRASGPPPPVLDKTGLAGTYEIAVDIGPEPGFDIFSAWQRVLTEKLGLRLEGRRGDVSVLVIDSAERLPTAN